MFEEWGWRPFEIAGNPQTRTTPESGSSLEFSRNLGKYNYCPFHSQAIVESTNIGVGAGLGEGYSEARDAWRLSISN
jgi:hypothetical protein